LEAVTLQYRELAVERHTAGMHGHHLKRLRIEESKCIEEMG
jgi:hypothetical protein